MAKVTFEYDADEERDAIECAMNGWKYGYQLEEMWEKLFRPRHKHGYASQRLNELLGLNSEEANAQSDACNEVMDILESLYREVLDDE